MLFCFVLRADNSKKCLLELLFLTSSPTFVISCLIDKANRLLWEKNLLCIFPSLLHVGRAQKSQNIKVCLPFFFRNLIWLSFSEISVSIQVGGTLLSSFFLVGFAYVSFTLLDKTTTFYFEDGWKVLCSMWYWLGFLMWVCLLGGWSSLQNSRSPLSHVWGLSIDCCLGDCVTFHVASLSR